MNYCRTCIMPDTRPDTEFVDGECAACIAYRKRSEIDWDDRENQLAALHHWARDRMAANGTRYDCVVPSSGGKDSTAQVIKLLQRGWKPLVVTAATCHPTQIGRLNIENLAEYAPTYIAEPNRKVRRHLNARGLRLVGDISWPEHVAIFTVPFQVAVQQRIPVIFYGENPQNQYGGPLGTTQAMEMTARWRSEFGGFLGMRPSDMAGVDGITMNDMAYYEFPKAAELAEHSIQAHFLGQYLPWYSHENADLAIAHGLRVQKPTPCNWWPWENMDNAQTGIHDHLGWRKYGYTRGQAQLSVDIRSGLITRDTAIEVLRELPKWHNEYMGQLMEEDILAPLGVTMGEYRQIADRFTNWDIMRRVDDDQTAEPILVRNP